jgi:hypothetical protein
VTALDFGDLGEAQRVGWRAQEDGRPHGIDQREALVAGHAAAGHAVRADLARGFERGPEAEERPEREREQHAIAGLDAGRGEHRLPAVEGPLPAGVGVEPAQRTSGRRRRLVVARVGLDRLGVCAAPGRVGVLVGDQLRLRRARQGGHAVARHRRGVDACGRQLARVERVAAAEARDQGLQALRLVRGQGRTRGCPRGRGHATGGRKSAAIGSGIGTARRV